MKWAGDMRVADENKQYPLQEGCNRTESNDMGFQTMRSAQLSWKSSNLAPKRKFRTFGQSCFSTESDLCSVFSLLNSAKVLIGVLQKIAYVQLLKYCSNTKSACALLRQGVGGGWGWAGQVLFVLSKRFSKRLRMASDILGWEGDVVISV